MPKHDPAEVAFVIAFLPVYLVNASIDAVRKGARKVENAIDEVRCEMHNRRHFDKKYPRKARKTHIPSKF